MPHSFVPIIVIVLLVAWSIYRRVRRSIGWQSLRPRQMTVRMVLLAVVMVLLLVASGTAPHVNSIWLWSGLGILVGLALAGVAIRTTQIAIRDGALTYRPNTWIGALLLAVFFGRLLFRVVFIYQAEQSGTLTQAQSAAQGNAGLQSYSQDPWTLSVFLVLTTYYVLYYALLLRKSRLHQNSREDHPLT